MVADTNRFDISTSIILNTHWCVQINNRFVIGVIRVIREGLGEGLSIALEQLVPDKLVNCAC